MSAGEKVVRHDANVAPSVEDGLIPALVCMDALLTDDLKGGIAVLIGVRESHAANEGGVAG